MVQLTTLFGTLAIASQHFTLPHNASLYCFTLCQCALRLSCLWLSSTAGIPRLVNFQVEKLGEFLSAVEVHHCPVVGNFTHSIHQRN